MRRQATSSVENGHFTAIEDERARRARQGRAAPLESTTDDEHGVMEGRIIPTSYPAPHPLLAVATNTRAMLPKPAARTGRSTSVRSTRAARTGSMVMVPWVRRDPTQNNWSLREIYQARPR
jgi:hypothetical protein